jgi:hypothetical protein
MTTMRSAEPLTGIDAVLTRIFPFLNGTEPRAGEVGRDWAGAQYSWQPGRGWVAVTAQLNHDHDLEAGS